ncbi:MAG: hypothetical protein ACXW2E_01260 [Nitrososphaeraceae archaeon]
MVHRSTETIPYAIFWCDRYEVTNNSDELKIYFDTGSSIVITDWDFINELDSENEQSHIDTIYKLCQQLK